MNGVDQQTLGALFDSVLVAEKPIRDGARIVGWERVSGAAVLGRLLAATGWRIRAAAEPYGAVQPQSACPTSEGRNAGRADIFRVLKLVRRTS